MKNREGEREGGAGREEKSAPLLRARAAILFFVCEFVCLHPSQHENTQDHDADEFSARTHCGNEKKKDRRSQGEGGGKGEGNERVVVAK